MNKEEKVINYYLVCNKLKYIIRSYCKIWNIHNDRLESIAEHVYGVQMLALSMYSEFKYDIDIEKVLYMLAIHELGESVIGDITMFDLSHEEKEAKEHEAVHKILDNLLEGKYIEELFLEFDECKTKEAFFAFQCDKMEADLQAKIYGDMGCVDLNDQPNNVALGNKKVRELLDNGDDFGTMWLEFSQDSYPYDENFKSVSNYPIEHKLILNKR